MSWILHIETSTDVCSVAIGRQGELVLEMHTDKPRQHISMLSLLINQVLFQVSISFSQLSAIAISSGPGSYTGLRVGFATVKGLCYSLGIPLIDINTLNSLAVGMHQQLSENPPEVFLPMIDARRMEVYIAAYDSHTQTIRPPEALVLDEQWFDTLTHTYKTIAFGGNGAFKVRSLMNDQTTTNQLVFCAEVCSASFLVEPAWSKFCNKDFADLTYSEPFYLKSANITKPKRSTF